MKNLSMARTVIWRSALALIAVLALCPRPGYAADYSESTVGDGSLSMRLPGESPARLPPTPTSSDEPFDNSSIGIGAATGEEVAYDRDKTWPRA